MSLKFKIISGIIWRFLEKVSVQFIRLIVTIILARILEPEDFGIVAFSMIFMVIADTFVSNGFGAALIQKKNIDDKDISTMLWAGLIVAFLLYICVCFVAPWIENIYGYPELANILIVLGIRIPIAAFNSIQEALISRKLEFRTFYVITLAGTLISAIVGVWLAFSGFGVWALIIQYIVMSLVNSILLCFFVRWKPKMFFSYERFFEMFSFSWRLMISGIIGVSFDQLRSFLIGIKYTAQDLSFVNQGEKIPALVAGNISAAIQNVLFPAFSKIQNDKNAIREYLRSFIIVGTYLLFPVMMWLIAVAPQLVSLVFSEKWLPAVPYLQIMCIQQCCSLLSTMSIQTFKSIGLANVCLDLELKKKPIYLCLILVALPVSPLAVVAANAVYSFIGLMMNIMPLKKYVNYGLMQQGKDLAGNIFLSLIVLNLMIIIDRFGLEEIRCIVAKTLVGVVSYFFISFLFRIEGYKKIYKACKKCLRA